VHYLLFKNLSLDSEERASVEIVEMDRHIEQVLFGCKGFVEADESLHGDEVGVFGNY
jgi:hypothetical protein